VPAVYAGCAARLAAIVRLVCAEMGAAFAERGTVTPPWRSAQSLLSKWLPSKVCRAPHAELGAERFAHEPRDQQPSWCFPRQSPVMHLCCSSESADVTMHTISGVSALQDLLNAVAARGTRQI
jgi:hypothetical protein